MYNKICKDITQVENGRKDEVRRKKEKKNGRNKENAD